MSIDNQQNKCYTTSMDLNQYEQIKIKCQYISAVCDQLFHQLETPILSKVHYSNKLLSDPQSHSITNKYGKIQNQLNDETIQDQKQYQARKEKLQIELKQNKMLFKKLRKEITLLKDSKYENVASSRMANKKIRESLSLQSQVTQLRRLLNCELQNLNSLETSSIQIKQAIESFDKKEISLKSKLNKMVNKQKEYLQFRQMEEKYESLLLSKRKIVQDNSLFEQKKHDLVYNKISAIAQSKENLKQMEKYQKDLELRVKQQKFIIDQIEIRQVQTKNQNDQSQALKDDDDSDLFEQEISSLKKTIANRKFQQRAKHLHQSNKLEAFRNELTPKNNIDYRTKQQMKHNSKQNTSSLFKIQIQPVSHFSPPKPSKDSPIMHRSSLPSRLKRNKPPQNQNQSRSENKLPDLETIQIQTLQKILKKKQEQIKYAINTTQLNEVNHSVPILKNKNRQPIKKTGSFQLSVHTEPIQKMKQESIEIGPNSRFIEQLIESKVSQSLSKLNPNVRIRTKKSESEKLKSLQKRRKLSNQQKSIQKTKFSSRPTTPPKTPKIKIKTQQSTKNNIQTAEDNEFIQKSIPIKNFPKQDPKLKYKDKLSILQHQNKSIESVFRRIDQLKRNPQQNSGSVNDSQENPKSKREKVKVFKLSSVRKYGNAISFQRKGKAQGIEQSESEQQLQLPKIQEQEQSIRNTLQSIAYKQNTD